MEDGQAYGHGWCGEFNMKLHVCPSKYLYVSQMLQVTEIKLTQIYNVKSIHFTFVNDISKK